MTPLLTRWLVLGAMMLAAFIAGEIHGRGVVYEKWNEAIADAAKQAQKIIVRQGAETVRIVTQFKDRITEVKGETQIVEKLVPTFVPVGNDPALPRGWRLLHDAATTGAVPEAPAGLDVAAPDVKASAAARGVVENYGACRVTAVQLLSLQHWVRTMYQEHNLEPLGY